jgi:hypothetical protein
MQEQSDEEGTKNEKHEGYEGIRWTLGRATRRAVSTLRRSRFDLSRLQGRGWRREHKLETRGWAQQSNQYQILRAARLAFSTKMDKKTIDMGTVQRDGFQGIRAGLEFHWVIAG